MLNSHWFQKLHFLQLVKIGWMILRPKMDNCFIESSCAKCHDFESVDIFFIRCSSTIRFIALRHPIDPIDPGCLWKVESFTEEAAKVIDVISCRCGRSRFLGPTKEIPWVALPTTNLAICWTVYVGQPLILRYT